MNIRLGVQQYANAPDTGQGSDVPLLLKTKITAPRRGRGILPRPRLEQHASLLNERRLAILMAPPGFGKTTLASIWADALQAQSHAVAWLSLDAEDDSAQRLLFYIAAALSQADPTLGQACLSLRAELTFFSTETLASLLINELSRREQPITLFIDDLHCIDDAVLVDALRFLLQRAPSHFHLVFITRNELPPALLEHLYADDLLEIDGAQLRFELEETRDLLRKAGYEPQEPSDINRIQESVEGWIAALRAFLLTPGHSIVRIAPRTICNLFEEVVRHLDEPLRQNLYPLGLLEKFSEGLLAALLGRPAARQLLEQLQQRQLFVTALDPEETWFSLHPLFREHLKKVYLRQHESEAREVLVQAANWFAERKLWLDAIRLGLDSGEVWQVKAWIEHCATTLIEQGDFTTLVILEKRWKLQSADCPLPLKMARAWAMGLSLEIGPAHKLAKQIEAELWAESDKGKSTSIYWEVQALQAMLLGLADHNMRSGPWARRCYDSGATRPWVTNVLLNLMSGSLLRDADWEALYQLPPTMDAQDGNRGYFLHECYRQSLTALAEGAQGRISYAVEGLQALVSQIDQNFADGLTTPNPVLLALPNALLAHYLYLRGEMTQAADHLQGCLDYINMGGFLDCIALAFITSARLQAQQGQALRARQTLEQMTVLAQQREWPRLQAWGLLERVRLCLQERRVREAAGCLRELQQLQALALDDGGVDRAQFALLAELWLGLAGQPVRSELVAEAHALLADLRQRQFCLMTAELGLALGFYLAMHGDQQGDSLLSEALGLIRDSGAVALLRDIGVAEACTALAAYVPVSWHAEVITLLGPAAQVEEEGSSCAALLALTVKERQVIQRVAEGKSNKQIAKDLSVTPETIKSHMKSIFAKLKVESRAQAAVMLQQG
ncbi:LuxR C-terminal-related transcriptional regulator [Halopseudomonas sabulinigri]|uniref:HTH luxR-type domain-containing protein n=1 Tax=Halopseudomonas sabulinigri TaxID=472181 RepID=A0ABP9ZJP1_9GAMM